MARDPLRVEVVSADRLVWSADAINVIARTVDGDIGILPGHEPVMAVLAPCAVEIVTADGRSETVAVDGGVTEEIAPLCAAAGVQQIVVGRALLTSERREAI